MKYFFKHPFKAVKAILPKSMLGRTLLILVAPLVLLETISTYVYFGNHWDHITKSLANNIAGEVATVVALYNKNPEDDKFIKYISGNNLKLWMEFIPRGVVRTPISGELKDGILDNALRKHLFTPYTFEIRSKNLVIQTEVENGVLEFSTPAKRLYDRSFSLYIMWVTGTSAILLLVAAIFLQNQVKPLRRLAIAADRFGKGRSFPLFKPEGAIEVRKVAQAFLDMKSRLHRQLTQRAEMLAGVSHDLRTPLTRMQLQLAMMPPSAETEGLQKDVDEMNQMLEGYLTFARGEGHEESRETDMNVLLKDVIGGRAQPDKIVHYQEMPSSKLSVKPQALKRCLMNLINNATRYGQEVWVRAHTEREHFIVKIEDNGPGIPKDKLSEVFKPFFRLDPSRNQSTGGVGLGLTIARDIAQSHGGDIKLGSSEKRGGLEVSLVLPY